MKQIPKRIINDLTKGWMRVIEILIHFPNTNNFLDSHFQEPEIIW